MPLSDRPIFVVGSPRSGTSLMSEMIDGHPNIFAPHWETGLFARYEDMLGGHLAHVLKNNKAAFPLDRADIVAWMRASVESLFTRFAEKTGKWRWAEKTPAHLFHMKLMHEMFPGAYFIHMIRDGRDVVRSLRNMPWAPHQLRWGIKRWMTSIEQGRRIARELPAGQYTEVRYEKLIADPQGELERLCAFFGETYSPRMLDFHLPQNNSWGIHLPPWQNKPINSYPSLGPMQRLIIQFMAGRLLRELGYT
jgi:hypothetical protein